MERGAVTDTWAESKPVVSRYSEERKKVSLQKTGCAHKDCRISHFAWLRKVNIKIKYRYGTRSLSLTFMNELSPHVKEVYSVLPGNTGPIPCNVAIILHCMVP